MTFDSSLSHDFVVQQLTLALRPLEYTRAMWEAGAAAFQRVDPWSDIDLMLDVEDDFVPQTFAVIEDVIEQLGGYDLKYEIPQPSWHGHAQTFYRLKRASPFLLLDIAVMKHSNPNKFLEPDMHGQVIRLFDKAGVIQQTPGEGKATPAQMQERLESLILTFDMFQILPLKEIERGNWIEALAFYNSFTLRPLVEVLRITHCPERYSFHTRYVYYDLPALAIQRLENLYFVPSPQDLRPKQQEAQDWFRQVSQQARYLYQEKGKQA